MAGADIDYILTNPNKVNWLKGVLVMEITDEAIRPFVEQEIKTFHNDIKSNFRHGSLCGNCTSFKAKHCPSGKCSDITLQIESAHRFKEPCYKNSHITQWLSDPIEIAKCYMSRSKDLEGKPCSEIDFPSVLNVVINNTRFERLITAVDMTDESNIFCQGRDARNETMHSRSYQSTDTKLNRHCDIFIEIVNLIGRDSAKCVEKIEKVRDTPLSITTEDIVKLKQQAARYQGLTDAVIEGMKKKLWDEAERILMYIKDETKKAIGTSLIPIFVEGCKKCLYRLIVEHVQRLKPERTKSDDWTVETFTKHLELHDEVNDLSKGHREMLFPSFGSPVDIKTWDIYLCCFVLNIKLHKPLENRVVLFIKNTKVLRDTLLDDPSGVDKVKLSNILNCFDKPMKDDIFEREHSVTDMFHANNALQSWRRDDEKEGETRYRSFQAETDAKLYQRIKDFEAQLSMVKSQIPQDLQPRLSRVEKLLRTERTDLDEMSEGANEIHETLVEVQPCFVRKAQIERLQHTMTSFDQNNHVLENTGAREYFENLTAGCAIKEIGKGSIILKVGCPSMESLFGFWKGCTDGTVVKAMSKIRDVYRKHLGCDILEFDIVLKKKEVSRCKLKIIEDLNSRLERLQEQVTGVNDVLSKPVEDLNSRLEQIEEHLTVVSDPISQQDFEGYNNSQEDTDWVQQNEGYMDDFEDYNDSQEDTDLVQQNEGYMDDFEGYNDSQEDTDLVQQNEGYMDDFDSMYDSQGDIDSEHHNERYMDVLVEKPKKGKKPSRLSEESKRLRYVGERLRSIGDDIPRSKIEELTEFGEACEKDTETLGLPLYQRMLFFMQSSVRKIFQFVRHPMTSFVRGHESYEKPLFEPSPMTTLDSIDEVSDVEETE